MIIFDINGAIVEFNENMDKYNEIRKIFKIHGKELSLKFEEECLNNISSIKQFFDKGNFICEKYIEEILVKGVETIVGYGVITVDKHIFKEAYCSKYLDFERLFNNISRENNNGKNKKNNARLFELKTIIKKVSRYLYNDCFNIHYAVIDALIDNGVDGVSSYIDKESIIKGNALFNNYKDGFISKADECKVIKQIIELNPYREEVYKAIIEEDGDFSKEVERLTTYLGFNILEYKAQLMDKYIKELIDNDLDDLEVAKEKVIKYSKYIGCSDTSIYTARIDAIYTFENA